MRTIKDELACKSKVFYDTEFEATHAAYQRDGMIAYRCPETNHYHITHEKKEERRGYGWKYWECPNCHSIINRNNKRKHEVICRTQS